MTVTNHAPYAERAAQAEADMRAAGLTPVVPYPGNSGRPWLCRCVGCGADTRPRVDDIRRGQGGCRRCADRRAADARRLSPDQAEAVVRRAGLTPLVPYPGGVARPWLCRCDVCGVEGRPKVSNIRSGQGGCRTCADVRATDSRRTSVADAEADMLAAGLVPLDPFPGSNRAPWRCRCDVCGAEVSPRLGSVRRGQGGCRACGYVARMGPQARTGGVDLYLVHHPGWRAVKVGIAASGGVRLHRHRVAGWSPVRVWPNLTPEAACAAERAVLSLWRGAGIPDAVPAAGMPYGGHTETAPADLVDVAVVARTVAEVLTGATTPGA